jgi:hypothetical protein
VNDQPTPFDAAFFLSREMGRQRAVSYIRAVLSELAEPEETEEKAPLLDEGELETLELILKKVRAVS